MRIREVLKNHYQLTDVIALYNDDLASVRARIALNERRLAEEFPSYGVAKVDGEMAHSSGVSDPTFALMLKYKAVKREIGKTLTALYTEEESIRRELDDLNYESRRVEVALSYLDASDRELIRLRYKERRNLQEIALKHYTATDPHTASDHLEQVEGKLVKLLDRQAIVRLKKEFESSPFLPQKNPKRGIGNQLVLVG